MNKYLKWFLVAIAILSVLFAVGCTKSVVEGTGSQGKGWDIAESKPAIAVVTDAAYDIEESDVEYYGAAEPAVTRGYMPPYYDDNHYGDGEDLDDSVQIIRSGSMSLEVDDYFIAEQKVSAFAKKYNGYVSSSYANTYNNRKSGSITIRVPEMHFDAVVAELSLLGDITAKNINGQDVTEQYIDLQARVNNSKVQEQRLLEMYNNASDVNEMMKVENQLSRVRGEVERMEGQLRYLKNRVAMSSLTVTLSEPMPVVKEWGIWKSIKNALNHSLATLRWMIELFGWLLPLAAVGVLIGLLIRLLRRKNRASIKRR